MEGQTQQCSNCHNMFPTDRIELHEAYCCRNIRKCKKCQKMIDIKDQEQHEKEFHDKKQCLMCNQMIEPSLFVQHQQICPNKPKICKYCQNSWMQKEFAKHFESCGARTKPCVICHKNIMIKEFDSHQERCMKRREERAEISQDHQPRGQRRNERGNESRQNSTNNIRDQVKEKSLPKIIRPNVFKPSNIIGPEVIRAAVDPVPISVRLALKLREQARLPLKNKN